MLHFAGERLRRYLPLFLVPAREQGMVLKRIDLNNAKESYAAPQCRGCLPFSIRRIIVFCKGADNSSLILLLFFNPSDTAYWNFHLCYPKRKQSKLLCSPILKNALKNKHTYIENREYFYILKYDTGGKRYENLYYKKR